MANDERFDAFRLYYFGQDRFGAWPFLAMAVFYRAFGVHWSPEAMYTVQFSWVVAGLVALGALVPSHRYLVPTLALLVVVTTPPLYQNILSLDQPYGWLVTPIVAGWYCVRRFYAVRSWWLAAAFAAIVFLASWLSPLAVYIFAVIVAVEWVRAFGGRVRSKRALTALFPPGLALALGFVGQNDIKAVYHRHILAEYGRADYITPLAVDWQHLAPNVEQIADRWAATPWVFTVVSSVALCGLLIAWLFRARLPFVARCGQHMPQKRDLLALAVGATAIAALNFAAASAVEWVRLNDFDVRYLTLAMLFWPLSFLALALLALPARVRHPMALLALAATLAVVPNFDSNAEYAKRKAVARALAGEAPSQVLLGSYWGTYVFSALALPDEVIPVPAEGEEDRMPWTVSGLIEAEEIVVSHYAFPKYGPAERPAQKIEEFGVVFKLAEAGWLSVGEYSFSIYRRATEEAA